ncbi:MAG: MFS transporter [Chlorobiota bacterium]|nr:MAG: MFS transporter [Chlorobiota bacterium]
MIKNIYHQQKKKNNEIASKYPNFKHNYLIGVINGVIFNFGLSFFSRDTIIPVYLASLGAPSLVISFVALFDSLGWYFPQLFVAKYLLHLEEKLPIYKRAVFLRIFGILLAVFSANLAFNIESKSYALITFVLGFGIFCFSGGISGVVFTDIVYKTVPKEKRGTYFAWRAIGSGIIGIYAGVGIIKPIIKNYEYPLNYLILFSSGAVLMLVAFILFFYTKEPKDKNVLLEERTFKKQIKTAVTILKQNKTYRNFVLLQCLMNLWFAGVPFVMLYAKENLGAIDIQIGEFITWGFAGTIISNLLLGYISNQIGNKSLMVTGTISALFVSISLLVFPYLSIPFWTFGFIFFASATAETGISTGSMNYMLETVPEEDRTTYIGLKNTLSAFAYCIAALIGSLRDIYGARSIFYVTGVIAIAALFLLYFLPEPRAKLMIKVYE